MCLWADFSLNEGHKRYECRPLSIGFQTDNHKDAGRKAMGCNREQYHYLLAKGEKHKNTPTLHILSISSTKTTDYIHEEVPQHFITLHNGFMHIIRWYEEV